MAKEILEAHLVPYTGKPAETAQCMDINARRFNRFTHQGRQRCRVHPNTSVGGQESLVMWRIWWNSASYAQEHWPLESMQAMLPTNQTDYLWQKIATNLFQLKGEELFYRVWLYIYFSRFRAIQQLSSTTPHSVQLMHSRPSRAVPDPRWKQGSGNKPIQDLFC